MNKLLALLAAVTLAGITVVPAAAAADHVSISLPIWTFAAAPPAGQTRLIRTPQGLTAQFKTTDLPAGHAVTLWIMFFDNPGACATPFFCDPGIDIGNPAVGFDFHYAAGHIVNGATNTLSGHVRVGETSTSGWAELVAMGGPQAALITPLTNPLGAQVILAIHSHGPAQTGTNLAAQMSSYLGGCTAFLGDAAGFATGFGDIPALEGECSTIQLAFHSAN